MRLKNSGTGHGARLRGGNGGISGRASSVHGDVEQAFQGRAIEAIERGEADGAEVGIAFAVVEKARGIGQFGATEEE